MISFGRIINDRLAKTAIVVCWLFIR